MGFRNESYATVWSVEVVSDTFVKGRISISHKDKQTGEYNTDFSGFVSFVGTATAKKAAALKEKDRIHLERVDVTNKYDKEKNVAYTNFKIFAFETQEKSNETHSSEPEQTQDVDNGEIDDSALPF